MLILASLIYIAIIFTALLYMIFGAGWFDRVTKGHYNPYKSSLVLMLNHLQAYPGDWKISAGHAQYPKEGSYRMFFDKGRDGDWTYVMDGESAKPVSSYFAGLIEQSITQSLKVREFNFALRNLYPDQANLMLENRTCSRSSPLPEPTSFLVS